MLKCPSEKDTSALISPSGKDLWIDVGSGTRPPLARAVRPRQTAGVFQRSPLRELAQGARGKPPVFVVALLAMLATGLLADAFFELRPLLAWTRLDAAVWERGELWRVITFGLFGTGGLGLWTVLQLGMIYWLTLELCAFIGERRTQVIVLGGIVVAGMTAVGVEFLWEVVGDNPNRYAFTMVQGQRCVLAVLIPAFAVRHRHSMLVDTPLLFGLPLPTKWLIPLQLLGALASFAALRDVGGLAGVLAATAWGARLPRKRRQC